MPLRFPRTVAALLATGAAAASIGVAAAPASADQVRHQQWWLASTSVSGAWPATQGAGVTVAVLSDGINTTAPDLRGAVTVAPPPAGAPVASSPYAGEVGTPAASLIAGRGHGPGGNSGIIGIAPQARILSVAVTLPTDDPAVTAPSVAGGIPAAIAAGIRYAVSHGAQVIDLPIDPGEPDSSGMGGDSAVAGGSAAEQSAVSYAVRHNVVLVAPAGDNAAGVDLAGNSAPDAANYPAAYHGVIAVGATDSGGQLATWSSQQSYVALTAPGEDLTAASNAGSYQTVSSTSYASAVVAGVAALIRSRYPDLTASQVQQALTSGAVPYQGEQGKAGWGSGAVNAVQALTAAARLATPDAHPAGAGARQRAASAGVAATQHGIAAKIKRAGLLSGILLVFLLLLIGLVVLRRRRTARRRASAGWTQRQTQSRYPRPGSAGPDQHPGVYLARQPALAAAAAPAGAAAAGRASAGTGPAGPGPARQAVPVAGPPGRVEYAANAPQPGAASGPQAPGAVPQRERPPARSPAPASNPRRPVVSGAPPWEPAVAPTSELPWAASAGRHSSTGRPEPPIRASRALPPGSAPAPGTPAGASPLAGAASEPGPRSGAGARRRRSPRGLPGSTQRATSSPQAGSPAPAGAPAESGPQGLADPRRAEPGHQGSPNGPEGWPQDMFRPAAPAGHWPVSAQAGSPASQRRALPAAPGPAVSPRPATGARAAAGRAYPGPGTATLSAASPSAAGPSAAGPSAAGPSAASPSAAGPSAAGPSAAGPSAASPSGSPDPADPPLHRAPTPPLRPATPSPLNGPPVAPSGLPIRRPGATQPAPLSPSGSLWEPASSPARARPDGPGSASAGSPASGPPGADRTPAAWSDDPDDSGSGPVFVRDAAAGRPARRGD